MLTRWSRAEWPLQDSWKEAKCLLRPVTVHIPGSYTNQDYLCDTMGKIHWIVRERESIISDPFVVCFSWEGEWSVTVSMSVWKDRAKLICVWTGWCVYAVTLPLIQLSKLLSDARDWQGFHSTVLDTQTHNSLSVFACIHKSSFLCFIHAVSLSLCLCVSAPRMISSSLQLPSFIGTGVRLWYWLKIHINLPNYFLSPWLFSYIFSENHL